MATGVVPSGVGARLVICGHSLSIMTIAGPNWTTPWAMRPSSPGRRTPSTPPSAAVQNSISATGLRQNSRGITTGAPSGMPLNPMFHVLHADNRPWRAAASCKKRNAIFRHGYTRIVRQTLSAFRVYRPSGPLAPFVGFLWSCDRYVASHSSERVLPTGTADVIFRGDDCRNLRGVLTGPRSKYVTVSTERPFAAVGVHFRPGGAYPFFGGATSTLADAATLLADLWGSAADDVSEHLASAAAPEDRFRILEQMLLARVSGFVPRPPIRSGLNLFNRS